ncbi:hypothetical protein ACH5RR_026102 [Cinchona calisaya]|uniref:Uncharacterized protein n=1 Tax=Cinchona calisaya TaxID=153742 RepID=A0ABD2Z4Y0_9GENT
MVLVEVHHDAKKFSSKQRLSLKFMHRVFIYFSSQERLSLKFPLSSLQGLFKPVKAIIKVFTIESPRNSQVIEVFTAESPRTSQSSKGYPQSFHCWAFKGFSSRGRLPSNFLLHSIQELLKTKKAMISSL